MDPEATSSKRVVVSGEDTGRLLMVTSARVQDVVLEHPTVDLAKHQRRTWVSDEFNKHNPLLQHRLSGYTVHHNVRQALRHQPLQLAGYASSRKW